MTVIAVYNMKGGVGKTATSVNFAYLSAVDGVNTLLWDIDPQGAASYYYNLKPAAKNEGKKLFSGDIDVQQTIQPSNFENLSVIPADLSLRNMDILLDDQKQSKKRLKMQLNYLKQFDVVILDCPPGISLLHENIFAAADFVIMPNIPTTLSIHAFETVMQFFDDNGLDKTKVKCFFSMVDHRKNLHHEVMQQFYKDKLFYKNYIPYLSDVEKMGSYQQPIFEFANTSYAAQCYRDLWNEVKKSFK